VLVFTVSTVQPLTLATMKAELGGVTLADASDDDVVRIEGNWYFATHTVAFDHLTESPTAYTCSWKGACQYYHLSAGGSEVSDGAWAYPDLIAGAAERVGRDFSGWVAFGPKVAVS
jgi:uncharacterized protein (DUF427 family)